MADKDNALKLLCGPMVPVVTHYNPDLTLDLSPMQQNLRFLINHGNRTGAGCLLVGAAGGDFTMLNPEERKAVARAAMEAVGTKVPVVIGGRASDERVVLELAELAESLGAYAIQVSPPYYFEPSDDDVLYLFRKVNSRLKKTGIMVYNTWWEGYNMSFNMLDRLVDLDRVISIKWSSPDSTLAYMRGVERYASKVAVIDNNDSWPLTALLGGSGFITHLTNLWPEHDLETYSLTQAGQCRPAMDSMRKVDWPFIAFRGKIAKRTSGEGPVIRAALELCRRPGRPSRPPSRSLTPAERTELRSVLADIGVLKT